jgi:hypothetical protein
MQYRLCTLLIVLALGPPILGCVGCSTPKEPPPGFYDRVRVPFPPEIRRVLDDPDGFMLYSIEGENEILPDVREHSFHGFNILGKTVITDAQQRKSLIQALDEDISKVTHGPALCFSPRHGISVVRGDTRFDLVICFECFQIHVLDGNGKHVFMTQTTGEPAAVFNQALASAQVPLAPPPSH